MRISTIAASIVLLWGVVMAIPAGAQPYDARRNGDIVQLEDKASQTVVSIITSVGNMAYEMTVKGHNILRFPFASIDDYRARPRPASASRCSPRGATGSTSRRSTRTASATPSTCSWATSRARSRSTAS